MDWLEIAVDTDNDAVEAVSEILMDCGAGGVVIEDPGIINRRIAENSWDAYEFPDELVNREFVRVKAYLPRDRQLGERMKELADRLDRLNREYMPGAVKSLQKNNVREEDWANSWKAYYKPVKIGDRIVIKPSWEEYKAEPGEQVIELDPGMAFGTGTHPTTVMCIRLLERVITGGETVFDIGTGSGILAITAAKLGAGRVLAVDVDEVAVTAARANVDANGESSRVEVRPGDLLEGISGPADVIVANIIADIIIRVCDDAYRSTKPEGRFIASGIIAPRAKEVKEKVRQAGFGILEEVREGDWVSLLAVRED